MPANVNLLSLCQAIARLRKAKRGKPKHWRRRRLGAEPLEGRDLMTGLPTMLVVDDFEVTGLGDDYQAVAVSRVANAVSVQDDHGNDIRHATVIRLDSNGDGQGTGVIERNGDQDFFRFQATQSGQMTITQTARSGSRLDSYLYVYDSRGRQIASNDDGGARVNSRVQVAVTTGQTYYVRADAYGSSTGGYDLTLATQGFDIDLNLVGMTDAQEAIARQAAERWEQIIVGDLPAAQRNGQTIDDVLINIQVAAIDNVGGTLGQGGPRELRPGSSLPYFGEITIDTADIDRLATGELPNLFEHEIAHVLGFGTIWDDLGLLTGAGGSDPRFTGRQATAEYNTIFNQTGTSIPVEAGGGDGTRLSHWRESVFDSELMTGWDDVGFNPLSRVTAASMADIGYTVNIAAADPIQPPSSTAPWSWLRDQFTPIGGGARSTAESAASLQLTGSVPDRFAGSIASGQSTEVGNASQTVLKQPFAIAEGADGSARNVDMPFLHAVDRIHADTIKDSAFSNIGNPDGRNVLGGAFTESRLADEAIMSLICDSLDWMSQG